ncbi:MAG: DUF2000 domain-containing protein [Candidatus Gottesmanbacteria bacterium]|nr:DUF2000 domain-containing protein [Candidatus Gottesmanbacteria bacterium]
MTDTEVQDKKIVIVISANLAIGQAANRAAVLATGLAAHVPNMIGVDLATKDGKTLLGYTQIPIPILTTKPDTSLSALVDKSQELGCTVILFLSRVQGMTSYEEYIQSIGQTNYQDLDIDAIALYGDKKSVTKITGNLPSLR